MDRRPSAPAPVRGRRERNRSSRSSRRPRSASTTWSRGSTAEADDGIFHTAAQLVVVHRGERDLRRGGRADPSARPVHGRHALGAVLHGQAAGDPRRCCACRRRRVQPRRPARRHRRRARRADAEWIADRTIEQVLAHTAGFHGLWVDRRARAARTQSLVVDHVVPPRRPAGGSASIVPTPSSPVGTCSASVDRVAHRRALRRRSSTEWCSIPTASTTTSSSSASIPTASPAPADDLGHLDLTGHLPVPLLAEVGVETACEWNPAFGCLRDDARARRFYERDPGDLERCRAGRARRPAASRRDAQIARRPSIRPSTARPASGSGSWPRCPRTGSATNRPTMAFGHAGQGGTSFGFVDPPHDLVGRRTVQRRPRRRDVARLPTSPTDRPGVPRAVHALTAHLRVPECSFPPASIHAASPRLRRPASPSHFRSCRNSSSSGGRARCSIT